MLGLYGAITRQDPTGHPAGGWMPEERLSREVMLQSFTWNAAYAAHAENDLGSLEVGKLADMVLIDRNVMTIDPKAILSTHALMTIIGGEVVYERQP
jgi:predicted amidohydrolase YtcJ